MADLVNEGNAMRNISVIATLAVVLLVVTLMITMGSLITETIQDTDEITTLENKVTANATLTNASTMTLGHSRIIGSTLLLWNGTSAGSSNVVGNTTYPIATTANFTCSGTQACTIALNDYSLGGFEEAADFNVQYTWQEEQLTAARNTTENGLDALDTVSGFLPVVGIVAIAAVIIAVVSTSFTGGSV